MAQRTVALCDGSFIGIETIFTVVNGKQINIPDKLKELRHKSQNNELFCPCGCGANLVLVASDKNLREQHYRIKDGKQFENCTVVTEGKTSVDSKIVLKCWLDENLQTDDIESRVPICDISDSNRKYEFTFISKSRKIAVDYCHIRANLSDEKQSILEQNSQGIKIIHVVDYMNGGSEGQFPEWLMKVQDRQKYCLLLSVSDADYETASMKAAFYGQDIDGLWHEIIFAVGSLREYKINSHGEVCFHGNPLEESLKTAILDFQKANAAERQRREDEKIKRDEWLRQQEIEAEKRREEQRKQQEAIEEKQRIQVEEAAKKQAALEEERRRKEEWEREEKERKEKEFKEDIETSLDQQEKQVRDPDGNRWIKCEYCGKVAMESEFSSYGGINHVNLGTCRDCNDHNPAAKKAQTEVQPAIKRKYDLTICPECGGKLVKRNGKNGRFMGCGEFPKCRYTCSVKV